MTRELHVHFKNEWHDPERSDGRATHSAFLPAMIELA